MTVINKVNDDSEDYFSEIAEICFVIQCCKIYSLNLLILFVLYYFLIIRALFLSFTCFVKVPLYLQNETSW